MEAGKILFDTNPMSMVCSIVCSHDRSDQSGKGRQLYAGVKCNHVTKKGVRNLCPASSGFLILTASSGPEKGKVLLRLLRI